VTRSPGLRISGCQPAFCWNLIPDNQSNLQDDYSALAAAQKEVAGRHEVWSAYHEVCFCVAKWTTTPLLNSNNEVSLSIDVIRQTVQDIATRTQQLRKQTLVRAPHQPSHGSTRHWTAVVATTAGVAFLTPLPHFLECPHAEMGGVAVTKM
jgi:hypothetical protein